MKIILIGYGKMGKEIEQVLRSRGHDISLIVDLNNRAELNQNAASNADLAIEFTSPESVLDNIYSCFDLGLPVVTGSTGWHDKLGEVTKKCIEKDQSLFHASNFSIGVNLFFELNEKLTKLMNPFPEYDVKMKEVHHTQKLDEPSGTAVSLAEQIIRNLERKNTWTLGEGDAGSVGIEALREGNIKGIHSVRFESDIDFIEIKHEAKTRKGFAMGSVLAAEFLHGKKGVYTMKDLLKNLE